VSPLGPFRVTDRGAAEYPRWRLEAQDELTGRWNTVGYVRNLETAQSLTLLPDLLDFVDTVAEVGAAHPKVQDAIAALQRCMAEVERERVSPPPPRPSPG
jgi:hypothetical protein